MIIKKTLEKKSFYKIKRRNLLETLSFNCIKKITNNLIHYSFFKKGIIIIIVLIFIIIEILFKYYSDYKICLCAVGKLENKYAVEYVEHYKNYGIDKIVIYDNNDRYGERFESVLSNYIKNRFVKIINVRGRSKIQIHAYNHCNWQNYQKYNWLMFFDFDEFIFLSNYKNAKNFFQNKKFAQCNVITLNELVHTDNNQIYYYNRSLVERFPEIAYNKKPIMVKPIIRGRIKRQKIVNNHVVRINGQGCDGFGIKMVFKNIFRDKPDYKFYFFNHFMTKSAEEYLIKIDKGDAVWGDRKINEAHLTSFFNFNKITLDKIIFFENKTHIKLKNIRERLKTNNSN